MTTMTETSAAIRTCKSTIAAAVNAAVETLRNTTGISPAYVDIHMVDFTTAGSPHEYAVGDVRLRFDV